MDLRIYKNKPMHWFEDFAGAMEQLWDSPLRKWDTPSLSDKKVFPLACDCHENKDYFFFSFDIPGVSKEDIQIEFNDNTLHISGEKKNKYEGKHLEGHQFHEKFYGKFQRSFTLPTAVKEDAIEAHFKDGVLELLIPKAKAGKGRKISVTESQKDGLFSRLFPQHNKKQQQ